jgi:dTDP-4-amino-4,6-dideoxygalactose transaminase
MFRQQLFIDQIANVINSLRTNPDDRRMIVTAWNVGQIEEMQLPPCHYTFQFATRLLSFQERLELFEKEFAEYIGQSFTVGVNSGTDALILSLRALNVGVGDEVIVPSFTAVATASAVVAVGAVPVYLDIDMETYTVDPDLLDAALSVKTKAVILVHLYGHPARAKEVAEWCQNNSLFLIEDCSQAHGAEIEASRVGTFGTLACFSFYPTKNLGGIGDGGAITTSDEQINLKLRMLRQYGWAETRNSQVVSQISRLDELQASILRVKLRHLETNNKKRSILART